MLELENIGKQFDEGVPVLDSIDLTVDAGEIICLLGPSGCGKTTLLRIIAGLEEADYGHITYHGENLADVPVHQRNFGFMFQDFALFPHRTVGENIAFGLRMAKWPSDKIDERIGEMLALIDLPGSYTQRSIFELSGGEQQRVALARSLAPGPDLLLLDEPLGNLDRALRESLMLELRAILKRLNVTAIYVTHDQAEAYAVADRIVLMRDGYIVQVGKPQELYLRPATPEVARFLGFDNILAAKVENSASRRVKTPIGSVTLAGLPDGLVAGDSCWLLIHPQAVTLVAEAHDGQETIESIIERMLFRGDHYEVTVNISSAEAGDVRLTCEVTTHDVHRSGTSLILAPGHSVHLVVDSERVTILGHE